MMGLDLAWTAGYTLPPPCDADCSSTARKDHLMRLLPPFIVTERRWTNSWRFGAVLAQTKRPAAIAPQAAEPPRHDPPLQMTRQ